MKILVIEDERILAGILKKGLEEHSFIVDVAFDGEEGLYMAETHSFDAVVLDIMLPKMDGFAILERLRSNRIDVPVLLLTARGDVEDRVKGLNNGADDYVIKPFEFSELLARLMAIIRRNKGNASSRIDIDGLVIDTNLKAVTREGRDIKLTAREYKIMEYLALNSGRIVSRGELIDHIYETDIDLEYSIINVYINYLRNKIDKGFSRKYIHTCRGAGYIVK